MSGMPLEDMCRWNYIYILMVGDSSVVYISDVPEESQTNLM